MRRLPLLLVIGFAACVVPDHRFDYDPDAIDAGPDIDAGGAFRVVPSGISIQGTSNGSEPAPGDDPVYDSQPVHRVYTSGYEISASCVSDFDYGTCVQAGACETLAEPRFIGLAQAAAYCAWIGRRLPTEAELERGIRGDDFTTTLNSPSPHGLFSCGNGEVGEWVADRYRCDAYVGRAWADPIGTGDGAMFRRFAGVMTPRAGFATGLGFRCARTIDDSEPPAPPEQPTCTGSCDVTGLALGERFGCALRADGSVWCWGSNAQGQLGTGDVIDAMPASTAQPPNNLAVAVEVAAGDRFACVRTGAGAVHCWGDNVAGQVGGAAAGTVVLPTLVVGDTIDLAVAGKHGCVVLSDQTVSCWGHGGAVPDGVGPTAVAAIGITGATAIAAGPRSECAITGATVRCWGVVHDGGGTLGYLAPATARSHAITATALALGDGHGCAVVGADVQCWGDRTHWGGVGVATAPEIITTATVAPRVFASASGTVVIDQGVVVINVGTGLPGTLAADGDAIAFDGDAAGNGCATTAGGVSCFGVEIGQLGRSNGCDATAATSTLALP